MLRAGEFEEFTLEERYDAPDGDGALGGELAEGELEEEERDPGEDNVQAVRDQEGACRRQTTTN